MTRRLLTVEEAAARIGCRPQALRRLMTQGRCPGVKLAGRWRVDAALLERWLTAQQCARLTPAASPRPGRRAASDLPPVSDPIFS